MKIQKSALVESFGETIGHERAESLLESAAAETGHSTQRRLPKDAAVEMMDHLASDESVDSIVQISARTVKTHVKTGNLT